MVLDKMFKNSKDEYINIIDVLFGNSDTTNYIYTLAEAHAIDLIAKTIAKSEIQTFELSEKNKKIEKSKGDLYWTLNIQPNFNETGTKFLYKLAVKLLTDGKALVLINKKNKMNLLYVADEYESSNEILYGKTFSNIVVSDDEGNTLPLNKTYNQNNTIYYSLKNTRLESASEEFKNNSIKLLKAIQNSFINANIDKWRLKIPGGQPTMLDAETKQPISYEKYKEKITEGLFKDEQSLIMLSEMFDLVNLNKDNKKDLTDYEKIVVRIGNVVAQKWNIPLDIFYGSKTEKSTGTNDFITFAVDPFFEVIEDGFNASLVGKDGFKNGEYIKINRQNITHRDVLESGTGIDKLTANRFSRNELNEFLGLPQIDEDWANEHSLTKNYANVEGGAEDNG